MRKIVSLGLVAVILGMMAVAILPVLQPQSLLAMSGSGTSGDPWVVMNATDLQAIGTGSYALSHYYELGGDIDASATATWNWNAGRGVYEGFVPIGTYAAPFTGQLNGNYYAITDLYIDSVLGYVGLFGAIGGLVQNLYVLDASITAEADISQAGVLAGNLRGSGEAERVYVRGTVDSTTLKDDWRWNGNCGGLVGSLGGASPYTGGSIDRCAAVVDVYGRAPNAALQYAGGLVGHTYTSGSIANSYARGSVSGSKAGGLIGQRTFTGGLSNSYSTGAVVGGTAGGLIGKCESCTALTNCFWDTQTSGIGISGGGTGKTTSEMKTTSTFTDAGWDFSAIWAQGGMVNHGYPYHDWWYAPHTIIEDDIYQVVWFQPNAIIVGTTLPNRTGEEDGIITWGANPAGISISYSMLQPEKEYTFEPFLPPSLDIIDPEPGGMTSDVALDRLTRNPLRPLAQILSSTGGMTERLAWLGIAIFVLIALMIYVQLKTTHIVFTSLVGLGVATSFYLIGVFPLWVVVLLVFGLVGSIIYERMPVL